MKVDIPISLLASENTFALIYGLNVFWFFFPNLPFMFTSSWFELAQ